VAYNKANYHAYFKDRVSELNSINHAIWGFVGASALLEYVTQLVNSGNSDARLYKAFFSLRYLNPKYNVFTYASGKQDLPTQMYHVFRCGLLHGFTLVPDSKGISKGARKGSIVLSALKDDHTLAVSDNCKLYTDYGFDACQLVLEPFVADIGIAIDKIFADSSLDTSIEDSSKIHPPFNFYA
jgi:hypothetical protein